MPVKAACLFVTVLMLTAVSVAAQPSHHPYVYRPVSISFVPGFSTNGPASRYFRSNLSLNIIGGELGQVEGVELGGVFNIDEEDVYGYQGAGVFNIVGGVFGGVQQAGVFNIVEQNMLGYQAAGVFNIADGGFGGGQQAGVFNIVANELTGAQMAGIINIVGGELLGAQLSGVANVAGSGCIGTQLAGVVNVAEEMSGLQLSGVVNVAGELTGAQIGVVNIAGTGRGVQLGLVNIADDMEVPIGLVSIVKNGQFYVNAWATEFSSVNIGVKTGSRIIYNVFMLGWRPGGDDPRLYAGLGIGGHIPFDRFFLDIDILNHGEYHDRQWFREGGSDLLSSLRLTGGWHLNDMLALTAGPTLNLRVSEHEDASASEAALLDAGEDWNVRIWPGFTVGLELF
jgi:hypothetical protein